ncbi:hypothetical protein V6Z79_003082 [Aspergillus fumigatus]
MQLRVKIGQWCPLRTQNLVRNYRKCAIETLSTPISGPVLKTALMEGYNPSIRAVPMGKAADYTMTLRPQQRICYYPGKLHGGIQAFYLDQIFADCCAGALTANLAISYLRPVNPQAPLRISTWPVRVEGRKVYMEGSIKIPDQATGALVEAVRATALFIMPKDKAVQISS